MAGAPSRALPPVNYCEGGVADYFMVAMNGLGSPKT
jgi:hypothetical protein